METGTSDAVWRKFLLLLLEPNVWQNTTICYPPLLRFFGSHVHQFHSDNIKKHFLPIGLRLTGPSSDTASERESCKSCGMGCWRAGGSGFPTFRMNHYPSYSEVCMCHFCLEVESNSLLRNFYKNFRLSERHVTSRHVTSRHVTSLSLSLSLSLNTVTPKILILALSSYDWCGSSNFSLSCSC